ncbi:MAG: hypothetical protein JNK48_19530 [Bryobacterales bacterium]|nr:hypothetical protein [Bryobacterales bacterium]
MDQSPPMTKVVRTPRGIQTAKVDDRGRLKMPQALVTYLEDLGAKDVFITSLDRVTAKIYTNSVWEHNREVLENLTGEYSQWGKDILFVANDLGEDASLDAQGRLLIPAALRKLMGLENAQVWFEVGKGVITFYNEEVYKAKSARAHTNLPQKVEYAEGAGVK